MVYLDNAASTKVSKKAANGALYCMLNAYANPSSLHDFGLKSETILNNSRNSIAKILGCKKEEIYFTSGATESINIALIGAARKFKFKRNILTSAVEHSATKNCLEYIKNLGCSITTIYPKDKIYTPKLFVNAIKEDCFLVSIMHVNNENGLLLPVEEIAAQIKSKNENILIHVDAAQSFCKTPINLKNIDLLSASGHKINAPKGVGILFIKSGVKILPLTFGGGQEGGMRPGTQATALIRALEIAAKENYCNLNKNMDHYKTLKETLIYKLKDCEDIIFNFNNMCMPYIVNISLKGIKSQVLMQFLQEKGFLVSSGAACSKHYKNDTLLNLGYGRNVMDSAIRISFGPTNSIIDIENLCENIILANKTLVKYK